MLSNSLKIFLKIIYCWKLLVPLMEITLNIYLYLTEVEWADAWVNGGTIPIKSASTYLSQERNGIMTPDETKIYTGASHDTLRQYGIDLGNSQNFTVSNNIIRGSDGIRRPIPDARAYIEHGLILSFCTQNSRDIAKKLGKKVCVEILNIEKTKKLLDKKLGIRGEMRECEYTSDHQRNHFLKSEADAWQNEFRIFWKTEVQERSINIPANTAKILWTI